MIARRGYKVYLSPVRLTWMPILSTLVAISCGSPRHRSRYHLRGPAAHEAHFPRQTARAQTQKTWRGRCL